MSFDSLCTAAHDFWSDRLNRMWADDLMSTTSPGSRRTLLYPNVLLCTQAGEWFITELIGATPAYEGLQVRRHKEASPEAYFYPFDEFDLDSAMFRFEGERYSFLGLRLGNAVTDPGLLVRFPFLQRYEVGLRFISSADDAIPMRFSEGADSIAFAESLIGCRVGPALRIKRILFAYITKVATAAGAFTESMRSLCEFMNVPTLGVTTCRTELSGRYETAAQLTSLFLSGVRETTLGEFLRVHEEIIFTALDARRFLSEQELQWQPGTSAHGDPPIRPDLLVESKDGTWSVCDLKLALRDADSITTGERRRRGFRASVDNGVRQLAHYAEYFSHAANRRYVNERFGAAFEPNPLLRLIVGNAENFVRQEVLEASRLISNLELMDWDTFVLGYVQPSPAVEAS